MKFNTKLWGLMCLLMILLVSSMSFADWSYINKVVGDGSATESGIRGQYITKTTADNICFDRINKTAGDTASTIYVRTNPAGPDLTTFSCTGTLCTGTEYCNATMGAKIYFLKSSGGSSYTIRYSLSAVAYPTNDTNYFNWSGGWNGADSTGGYGIEWINYTYVIPNTMVINLQNINNFIYWNTPTINLTWNVSNAQNGTMTLYKNGIINQTIFYKPIGYNITQITNNFLIGDNISYNLYLQNGTYDLSQNSSTITILPPSVNYINIINSSTLEKQNLLCNYSITNANNTIIDWLVNNTLIKNNSVSFNITDYTNSILGLPLSCRLNNSVPTQSYTSYNYSNDIIIGQNITFYAKLNYSLVDISNFQICYSIGCFNTTSNNITIWNYNISDKYIFSSFLYQTMNRTLNANVSNQTYIFFPFDSRSITFYFFDSLNNAVINNVSLNLYGNSLFNVYNYTTNNGTIYAVLTTEDVYTITAQNPNYQISVFELPVTANSYQIKNVYLVNSSNKITYTILENSNLVSEVTIKVLKFVSNSWVYIQECTTSDLGTCSLYLNVPNIYRYELYYNGLLVTSTGNELVDYTQRLFTISIGNIDFEEFNNLNYIKSNYVLNYYGSNNTYNFSLSATFPSSEVSRVCMRLYEENSTTYQFNNCLTYSNQAKIYVYNEILKNNTYYIEVYTNISGNNYILNKQTINLRKAHTIFGNMGIFLAFLIIIVCALLGIPSPSRIILLGVTGLTISSIIGFLPISWVGLSGLWILCLLVVWKIGN